MDIRIRAAVETAKILGTCSLIALGVGLAFEYMTFEIFAIMIMCALLVGTVWLCYTNCLRELRSQEVIDRLSSDRK